MTIFQYFTKACIIILVLFLHHTAEGLEANYILSNNTTLSNTTQAENNPIDPLHLVAAGGLLGGTIGVFQLFMVLHLEEHYRIYLPVPVRYMLIGPTGRFSAMLIRGIFLGAISGSCLMLLPTMSVQHNSPLKKEQLEAISRKFQAIKENSSKIANLISI